MKKLVYLSISTLLIAGMIVSCGKTTKGKVSNEWKVTAYSNTSVSTQGATSITQKENGTETTYTMTFPGDDPKTGTIQQHTMTINKDGSWETTFNRTMVEVESLSGMSIKTTTVKQTSESGTWSLLGKNKSEDFKKNERILFHILDAKTTTHSTAISTIAGTSTTNETTTSNSTTIPELNAVEGQIWIVEESKKDLLKLKSTKKLTNNKNGISQVTTNSITLEQK